jgi:hypothetical protein
MFNYCGIGTVTERSRCAEVCEGETNKEINYSAFLRTQELSVRSFKYDTTYPGVMQTILPTSEAYERTEQLYCFPLLLTRNT